MTGPASGSLPVLTSLDVHTSQAAQALLDPRTARLLEVFQAPCSASDAAARLDLPLDRVLYRVKRLKQAGLLRHVDTLARPGRPIRRYQVAARAFFVPFAVTPYETLEAYLAEAEREVTAFVQRNVARTLEGTGRGWGLRVAPGADGHLHSKLAVSADEDWAMTPDGPALLSFVYPALRLDFADAKAMQAELMAVFHRYAGKGGAAPYACGLTLCPVAEPPAP